MKILPFKYRLKKIDCEFILKQKKSRLIYELNPSFNIFCNFGI